jgi:outer membrane receptor protein involved in Fe transport
MAIAAPAFAQDEGSTVGELIVTAQKREEAIQDVPIAVSAFSQESLEKQKIDGGPNLVLSIPNVNFSKGNFTGYNFQIRGVGAKLVAASGDAGTGIHLNNAPLTANNLFESEFFDVERVEVLRGPQGTLYGRNATGGVVNLITAKPVDYFTALGKLEYGNYNTVKAKAMVNIPLGDMFAARVAGVYVKRDGFGDNLVTKHDIDDRDLWDIRATLAFNPTDDFSAWFLYDHFEEDDSRSRIGRQFCKKDPGREAGLTYSADPNISLIEHGFFSQGCQETSLYEKGVSTGTLNTQATLGGLFATLTGLQTGDAYAGKVQSSDIRNIESAFDPVYQSKTDIYEFNAQWDVTPELQLTSLTSYSELSLFTRQDYNRVVPSSSFNATPNACNFYSTPCGNALLGSPALPPATWAFVYGTLFPGGVVSDPQVGAQNKFTTFDISSAETQQFTQELRLQSDFDGPLNFNIGAIYLDFKATGDYYVMFNTGTANYQAANFLTNLGSGGAVPYPCPEGNPSCVFIDPNETPNRSGHNYYDSYSPYHLKSRAAFGEVYWQVAESFKITAGARFTDDTKIVENHRVNLGEPGSGVSGPPPTDPRPFLKVRFQEVTGRLGFDWKPELGFTDNSLIYGFYSRGYKAGGLNPACSSALSCPPPSFEPEFVDAYELGMKNSLLGGSMVLNLTGFAYDYKGYQISKIVNRASTNENIDAKLWGLELESIWEPVKNFRLNANLGYLNTEIQGGSSIDVFNRTQGDPNLVVVKSSSASNCVVPLAVAQGALAVANVFSPFALLGVCGNALATDGIAVDLEGKELPNSPDLTLSLGAQYTWEFGADWSATLRGDYYRQTDSFSRIYNSEADKIEAWDNVNMTFTVASPANGWSFELYAKNLTDEEAITDTYLTDDSSGLYRNAFYTDPRTFGISVTKTFGK